MRATISATAIFLATVLCPGALCTAGDTFTLPAGSTLRVRLATTLNSKTNQTGDTFTGDVSEPIISGGEEVVPTGSLVEGRIPLLKPPGRAKGIAEMRLTPETITTPGGVKYSIAAALEDAQGSGNSKVKDEEGTLKGPGKSKKEGAVDAGIGAGIGAGAGAIAGGGEGALYGLMIGAAAGAMRNVLKKHKDIVVSQGTELTFTINRAVTARRVVQPADTK